MFFVGIGGSSPHAVVSVDHSFSPEPLPEPRCSLHEDNRQRSQTRPKSFGYTILVLVISTRIETRYFHLLFQEFNELGRAECRIIVENKFLDGVILNVCDKPLSKRGYDAGGSSIGQRFNPRVIAMRVDDTKHSGDTVAIRL